MNRTFPINSPTLPSHIAYPIDLADAVRFGPNLPLAFFKPSHIFHGDVHVRMTKVWCQQPQEPCKPSKPPSSTRHLNPVNGAHCFNILVHIDFNEITEGSTIPLSNKRKSKCSINATQFHSHNSNVCQCKTGSQFFRIASV